MRKLLLLNLGENFSLLLLEVQSSNFGKHGRTTLKLAILNFEGFMFFLSLKIQLIMNFIKGNEKHSSAFYSCTMKNVSSGLELSLGLLQSHHHAVCACLWNYLTRVYEDIFVLLCGHTVTVCVWGGIRDSSKSFIYEFSGDMKPMVCLDGWVEREW